MESRSSIYVEITLRNLKLRTMCKLKFMSMLQVTLPTGRCGKHAVEEKHMGTPHYEPNSTCPVHGLTLHQLTACLEQSLRHSHFLDSTTWK
jgi:hypothetical protein